MEPEAAVVADNGVLPTVIVTRPKSFMVPVIFEKEDEPPAKLARGSCVRTLVPGVWYVYMSGTFSESGEQCYACIVSKTEIPKLASALQVSLRCRFLVHCLLCI